MKMSRILTCCLAVFVSNTARAEIQILEVMYNPNNEAVWEWVEVRNNGASPVNLNNYLGFNLGDTDITSGTCGSGPCPTINSANDPDTTIQPGEIAVIYDGFYGTGSVHNYVDQRFRDAWGLGAGVKLIAADFWPEILNTNGAQTKSIGFWATVEDWRADHTPMELDPENMPGVFTGVTTSFAHAAFYLDMSDEESFPAVDGDSSITWTGSGDIHNGNNWYKSVSGTNGAVTSVDVLVPGTVNGPDDVGNPGLVPAGTPATAGLHFTEILYDPSGPGTGPGSTEPGWEWIEVYNSSDSAIDLTGWVLDDFNGNAHSASNIDGGSVPAGGTAILYNASLDQASFEAAWGAGLNLVPVTGWTTNLMALNTAGDKISLWSSFEDYDGDDVAHANAEVTLDFRISEGFPDPGAGQSIFLFDLSATASDGSNWDPAIEGDGISYASNDLAANVPFHVGGDIGSPGTFIPGSPATPGDFDMDGDVDGRDFLVWQRNPAVGNLAEWQANYGTGGLAAIGSVPEPTSLAILALALLPAGCGRKR